MRAYVRWCLTKSAWRRPRAGSNTPDGCSKLPQTEAPGCRARAAHRYPRLAPLLHAASYFVASRLSSTPAVGLGAGSCGGSCLAARPLRWAPPLSRSCPPPQRDSRGCAPQAASAATLRGSCGWRPAKRSASRLVHKRTCRCAGKGGGRAEGSHPPRLVARLCVFLARAANGPPPCPLQHSNPPFVWSGWHYYRGF